MIGVIVIINILHNPIIIIVFAIIVMVIVFSWLHLLLLIYSKRVNYNDDAIIYLYMYG